MKRYGLVVIGGGTAGLATSIGAAGVGAKVLLAERDRTGGDCLWTGCVPSKALLAAADLAHRMRTADVVGLQPTEPEVDLAQVMEHVRSAQATIAPHDSPERLRDEGVEFAPAHARFVRPGIVSVGGRHVRYRRALVATGSRPVIPPIPGLEDAAPLTSETVWALDELPRRLLVLGGGPTGCELGQAFARLGSHVTLVEMEPRVLRREEPEAADLIASRLGGDDVDVRLETEAVAVEEGPEGLELVTSRHGTADRIGFDRILVAVGRRATTARLGLDTVGVELDDDGSVRVDATMRTTGDGIFAAGDVTGGPPFTHVAAYQAGLVVTNALFGLRRRASYDDVPWTTFTDPEVARVGMTEAQARDHFGDDVTIAGFDYAEADRAVCAGRAYGFVKLVAGPRDRVVGATIATHGGGESIAEIVAWLQQDATLSDVSQAVHVYPTFARGTKRAADEHLRKRWLSPRVRRVARPVLTALRYLQRPG